MREYVVLGQSVKMTDKTFRANVTLMRRSDKLKTAVEGQGEQGLLALLAVELHSKARVFVIDRLYIKYKKARERREKVELMTANGQEET